MEHIFISYSSHDRTYAEKVADRLRREGFEVWMDNAELRGGDDWWDEIVVALKSCSAIVVIMSNEAKQSKWVKKEVFLAENLNKPIFPLLYEGENWEVFVTTQFEDVRDGELRYVSRSLKQLHEKD